MKFKRIKCLDRKIRKYEGVNSLFHKITAKSNESIFDSVSITEKSSMNRFINTDVAGKKGVIDNE